MRNWIVDNFVIIKSWINDFIRESFGFTSILSMFKESLLIKVQYISTYLLSLSISFWIVVWDGFKDYVTGSEGSLDSWIGKNVYNPTQAIKLLFLFVLLDNLLGYIKSRSTFLVGNIIKDPENFDSGKFLKSWVRFGIQVFFVAGLFNLDLIYPYLQLGLVTHTIMFAFLIATFISAWNNAYSTNIVSEEAHQLVTTVLDLKKILRIFKSKYLDKHENNNSKKHKDEDQPTKRFDQ